MLRSRRLIDHDSLEVISAPLAIAKSRQHPRRQSGQRCEHETRQSPPGLIESDQSGSIRAPADSLSTQVIGRPSGRLSIIRINLVIGTVVQKHAIQRIYRKLTDGDRDRRKWAEREEFARRAAIAFAITDVHSLTAETDAQRASRGLLAAQQDRRRGNASRVKAGSPRALQPASAF